jgi:hypothetical protein
MQHFEKWLRDVFDHPETEKHREWIETPPPDFLDFLDDAPPETVIQYITATFNTADELSQRNSDRQIADGLKYLANIAFTCPIRDAFDPSSGVNRETQLACIVSINSLFERLFAVRCSPFLSHLLTVVDKSNPLNHVCYMWWDMLPVHGHPQEPEYAEIDKACLEVMTKTLQLDSIACQESALHGLGHWSHRYREPVKALVQQFLDTNPGLDPDLKEYALRAQYGRVL